MQFKVIYEQYLNYCLKRLKAGSYLDRQTIFKQFILPYFENLEIENITRQQLKAWQENLEKYSYKYKSKIRGFLYNFLKFVECEYNIPNGLKNVQPFVKDKYNLKRKANVYSDKEYLRLIAKIEDLEDRTIFNMLYLCQLRKGELCGLTWNDWLLDKKCVDINKTFSRINNYGNLEDLEKLKGKVINFYVTGKVVYILNLPKSPNSIRQVVLPTSTYKLLSELYKVKSKAKDFAPTDFIFGKHKTFLKYTTLANRFEKYRKSARLKKIRIHDLRHSGVSYLINTYNNEQAKNSLHLAYIIAERIGDNVEQVLNTYGHLLNNEQQTLIDKINI